MTDLNNNPVGDAWGNPLSEGVLADNTATVNMTHDELVQRLGNLGVIVRTTTQD